MLKCNYEPYLSYDTILQQRISIKVAFSFSYNFMTVHDKLGKGSHGIEPTRD